jgi:hypothetical protein
MKASDIPALASWMTESTWEGGFLTTGLGAAGFAAAGAPAVLEG